MRKCIFILFAALLAIACGSEKKEPKPTIYRDRAIVEGDSAVYGLAADGCDDSVVVFLPDTGGDPITYSIVEARKHHRVFGKPEIGDNLTLLINKSDSTVCDLLINVDELYGKWCYLVEPHLKQLPGGMKAKLPPMPDSLRQQMTQPREYGVNLQGSGVAYTIGVRQSLEDEDGPIEYPKPERYNGWKLWNGMILLTKVVNPNDSIMMTKDSVVTHQTKEIDDTFKLTLMMRDSLILTNSSTGKTWNLYRKEEPKAETKTTAKSKGK